jgi:predicted ester cyclase
MLQITDIARLFFEACETGKGWGVCKQWCLPDATFSTDAEHFAQVRSLEQYTERMKNLFKFIPDGRYELRSLATDEEGHSVSAYAIFMGTHTGQGGPWPPTGKALKADYVM